METRIVGLMSQKKISLVLLLFVAFIDYVGIGLVFPLFGLLLFDPHSTLVSPDVSYSLRGVWMGLLIAAGPMVLFFSSPVLGTLSDQKGRRNVLLLTLLTGVVSYLFAILGVLFHSLALLLVYRILYGISAGNTTVVQASLVDLSTPQEKAKHFGLYNMAVGAGFSVGPFLGGSLVNTGGRFGFAIPFCLAALMTVVNLCFVIGKYRETNKRLSPAQKMNWAVGFSHLKKAFRMKELRLIFVVMFLFFFGWDFFIEFASVFLIEKFHFRPTQIGGFYAYTAVFYAFFAGFGIRPFIKRFAPRQLIKYALFLGGVYFLFLGLIEQATLLWICTPPLLLFIALIYPTATTLVSDDAAQDAQGEVLGIYGSVQSLALIVSPFFAGSLVGAHPTLSVTVAGMSMILGAVIFKIFCR